MLRLLTAHHYSGEEQPEKYLREFIGSEQLDAVAHRVVHGGVKLAATCLIDEAVEAEIEHLAALAPLHNPRTGLDTRLPCAV